MSGGEATLARLANWLAGPARRLPTVEALLPAVADRLCEEGVPVDRLSVVFAALHALNASTQYIWSRVSGFRREAFDRSPRSRTEYEQSPFALVWQRKDWVKMRLTEVPANRFRALPELLAEGHADYLAGLLPFSDGRPHFVSFATRSPAGFSAGDLALIAALMEPLGAACELAAQRQMTADLLETYVGREPARRVLSGEIVRGQVHEIEAAILFSDLRGFTRQSMAVDETTLVGILNEYFDCIVPAVEAHGGDVLKYIGDGLLAIFPAGPSGMGAAAVHAFQAARAAEDALAIANARHGRWEDQALGIGLHAGHAAYGNIGSGTRLDFTVIGRDVNLAARISACCGETGASLLMSMPFVAASGVPAAEAGVFALHGVPEPVRLYRPA